MRTDIYISYLATDHPSYYKTFALDIFEKYTGVRWNKKNPITIHQLENLIEGVKEDLTSIELLYLCEYIMVDYFDMDSQDNFTKMVMKFLGNDLFKSPRSFMYHIVNNYPNIESGKEINLFNVPYVKVPNDIKNELEWAKNFKTTIQLRYDKLEKLRLLS